ncbi:hypothetical protein [Paraliobacillus salinarum]|uniref:hypothetical protein n=1 Tax=Paraliobacillus salinarum TaxID=1158996 RepID=UPI0015F4D5C3|nr:hypothetical protein [Paraliobacillus salinarum]
MAEYRLVLDAFKQIIQKMCKVNDISHRKPRFETIDNIVVISLKNHLKDGIDMDCFHILNFIHQITGPLGIKYNQQLYLYPNSNRVERITVSFKKEDYDAFNLKMQDGSIDN